MNFRVFILLIALILPSVFYAAVPPYIKGDTIENICKKVICDKEILKAYKSYYPRQFHKAFAISSYKSGNKYYIDYAGWSSKKQMRIRAEMAALTACGKHAKHYCKVLFLNNAIYDEDLYVLLTQTTTSKSSSSSNNNTSSGNSSSASIKITIPANAYASGSSWKCKTGYYKYQKWCSKLPTNSYASGSSWKCNSGYTRSGSNCIKYKTNTSSSQTNDEWVSSTLKGEGFLGKILNKIGLIKKKIYIPANAYASGSSWKCNSGYTRSGNSCIKNVYIPVNAYASGSSWKCNSGFKKVGTSCEKLTWNDGEFWYEEVEPGKNRLFKLGELLNYYGKTPKQRSQSTYNSNLINSRIEDEFEGYEYGNLYRLTNGQVWEQTSSTYKYKYKYRPRVTISNGNMFVEGMSKSVKVRRY